jgi:hypothetical protein
MFPILTGTELGRGFEPSETVLCGVYSRPRKISWEKKVQVNQKNRRTP